MQALLCFSIFYLSEALLFFLRLYFGCLGALFLSFLLAGIAITWDAYVIATKTSLPDSLVGIFGVIEPNFTNIGISFLASSSSLGVFKIAQLSNPGAVYSEINDPEEDGR